MDADPNWKSGDFAFVEAEPWVPLLQDDSFSSKDPRALF
jgi:hypothetical protein